MNGSGRLRASLHANMCVAAAHILVNVGVREWIWLNVCEYTWEAMFSAANMLVNVGVRE